MSISFTVHEMIPEGQKIDNYRLGVVYDETDYVFLRVFQETLQSLIEPNTTWRMKTFEWDAPNKAISLVSGSKVKMFIKFTN